MKTNRLMMIAVLIGMAMGVSAQSESKYGADSVACITNMSMYREYFKQWKAANYAAESFSMEMVNAWRAVFLNCPAASQYTYSDGEKIMDYFIATNADKKDAYIDTICMMMDSRAKYFAVDPKTGKSQVASIMGNKGYDIYKYNPSRYEEAYNVLKDAVALDPSQLQGAYLDTYFKATIDMVKNGKAENMTIINVYQELSEVLDNNIEALAEAASTEVSDPTDLPESELIAAWGNPDNVTVNESEGKASKDLSYGNVLVTVVDDHVVSFKDAKKEIAKKYAKATNSIRNYKGTKSNLDNMFQPYASCEDLIKVFSAKMAETPDDVTLLKRITTILDKKDCTDSKLFLEASVKLNELEPSPEASYNLGKRFFNEKKYSDAATFFEQATKTDNNDRRYRAYRNLALCYQNMKSYSKAREMARKAAQVDPTAGEPYLIIAMLYAESGGQFTGDIPSKAVYWAAVDKCQKARQMDPSIAEKANSLIRAYSQAFPAMEIIFYNDYHEGQSYFVGGWIGENTTIRAKSK